MMLTKLKIWLKKKWKALLTILGIGVVVVYAMGNIGAPITTQYVTADELYLDIQDINTYVENGKIYETVTDLMTHSNMTGGISTTTAVSYDMRRARYNAFFSGYSITDGITTTDPVSLKYQVGNKSITFKPRGLRWSDGTIISDIQETIIPTVSGNEILYKNLFGEGLSVSAKTDNTRFQKLFIIDNATALGIVPNGVTYLEIVFEVDVNVIIDGWNKSSELEIIRKKRLGKYSYLSKAKVWNDATSTDIQSFFKKKADDKLYFVKRIPAKWLKTAEFPIYTDTDITYGQRNLFESGAIRYIRLAQLETNKVVNCFMDDVDGDAGKCRVGIIKGKDITWGTVSEFEGDMYIVGDEHLDVCKLDTDKFVVVYIDDGADDDGFARVGTISETTISWGTATEIIPTDAEFITCATLDTDKFIACYNDETDSNTGKCVASTVSGTTITAGEGVAFNGGTTDYYPKQNNAIQLEANKFVNCFWGEDNNAIYCFAGTTATSTHITFGTVRHIEGTDLNGVFKSLGLDSYETDKFVLTYDDSGAVETEMIAFTVSGTTLIEGTVASIHNLSRYTAITMIDTTHAVVIYGGNGISGESVYTTIDWSTLTVSVGSPETFEEHATGGQSDSGLDIVTTDTNKIVIAYQDDEASDAGYAIIGTYLGTPTETDWDYYKEITINAGSTSGDPGGVATTTDGNYVIVATTTDVSFKTVTNGGKVKNDYGDFLISDTGFTTFYDFEIEKYASTTGELVVWIEVPSISSTSDEVFRIYYGNANGHDYSNVKATWNSADVNPVGVWHLSESPTVDSYAYDSTDNNNDGSFNGTMLTEDQVSGALDGSLDFDGGDDYVTSISSDFDLDNSDTILAWIYPRTFANYNIVVDSQTVAGTENNQWDIYLKADGTVNRYMTDELTSVDALTQNAWNFVAVTYDGSDIRIYLNGILKAKNTQSKPVVDTTLARIGARSATSARFDGLIDEVRIYDKALTQADITTIYNMEVDNSTFLTWGAETEVSATVAGETTVIPWIIKFE